MLSDKTKISLGAAILAIGGGAWFMSSLSYEVAAHAKLLPEMAAQQAQYTKDFYDLKSEIQVMHNEIKQLQRDVKE